MRLHDKKVFLDKSLLYQMINLRQIGLAYTSLEWLFGCHRVSIAYQCDKYDIKPDQIFTIERIISQVLPKRDSSYKIVNGERINLGKSYKEYLAAAR